MQIFTDGLRHQTQKFLGLSLGLFMGIGLLTPVAVFADGQASFFLRNCHAYSPISVSQTEHADCTVGNSGNRVTGVLVRQTITDANGNVVSHSNYPSQKFETGTQTSYDSTWVPKKTGTYTVQIAVYAKHRATTYVQSTYSTVTVTAAAAKS